jgi:hypothetical protein
MSIDQDDFDRAYVLAFDVQQVHWDDGNIVGEVANASNKTISNGFVDVIGYDENGDVIGAYQTNLQIDDLAPGAISPFATSARSDDPTPATFDVFVYGHVKR